jgi:DNA primase
MLVQSQLVQIFNDILGQAAKIRKGGFQATYHCPFCADKNPITQKLEIAIAGPSTGNYHCWRCNEKGRTFGTLLRKLKAPSYYRDELFKLTGDIRVLRTKTKEYGEVILPAEFKPMYVPVASPEYRNALAYLIRRGILKEDIVRYNIGYCEDGPYAYHVIIPSYDAKGNLNFFVGRRYYDTEGAIPHKKPECSMDLIGFEIFINYNEPLILVEGAFNAITIRRNAIPMFGKFPSKTLYEKMIINGVTKVYVCLDTDAENAAIEVCKKLIRLGIIPYFVKFEGGKDANEIGFDKSWECIKKAKEVDFSFLLKENLG